MIIKTYFTIKTILILPFLFAFCFTSSAQISTDKNLEKSVDSILSIRFKPNEPGIALLIAKNGKIVYEKAFGSANLELNVPLLPEMVFNLGSITKQFTAVAILQLVEKGKISLQDSIQKYIKDFPSKGRIITIENLLTHTSGIKDYTQIDFQEPDMERRDFKPKEMIDSFKNLPLEFEPGTTFKYSNSGYFLLGYIIEAVTGQTYSDYIQDNILKPLSLNHTYYEGRKNIIPKWVSGYKKEDGQYAKADFWSRTLAYSAGGLVSNVEDLYNWHNGLYSYRILSKETLGKAFSSFKLKDGSTPGYGYGWFIRNINGIRAIAHGGAISGFLTNEIYYPDQDVFVAALFNCECAPSEELSISISGLALGRPLQEEVKIKEDILNFYTGTYALSSNPKRTIVVVKEGDHLMARISGQQAFQIMFQSDTKCILKNITDATCEFIKENNRITKLMVYQNGAFEWKKIE